MAGKTACLRAPQLVHLKTNIPLQCHVTAGLFAAAGVRNSRKPNFEHAPSNSENYTRHRSSSARGACARQRCQLRRAGLQRAPRCRECDRLGWRGRTILVPASPWLGSRAAAKIWQPNAASQAGQQLDAILQASLEPDVLPRVSLEGLAARLSKPVCSGVAHLAGRKSRRLSLIPKSHQVMKHPRVHFIPLPL